MNFPDLRMTLLFLETLDCPLEKVRVHRKPSTLGDTIVVLRDMYEISLLLPLHFDHTFPVSRPLARAEKTVVPSSYFLYSGLNSNRELTFLCSITRPYRYSFSGRSRWNMLSKMLAKTSSNQVQNDILVLTLFSNGGV